MAYSQIESGAVALNRELNRIADRHHSTPAKVALPGIARGPHYRPQSKWIASPTFATMRGTGLFLLTRKDIDQLRPRVSAARVQRPLANDLDQSTAIITLDAL